MFWLAAAVLLHDPVVTGYVERLCQRLGPNVAVSVAVDTGARASALPGAGIRVTTGMIAGAQNEAELAGILAHEIAHYRMAPDRTSPYQVPPEDSESGLCMRFAGPALKFDGAKLDGAKHWEHEADQAAIAMLMKAGYDPIAMLRYFSTLRHSAPDLPVAFSAEDILIERLQLEATDHPMKDPVVDTAEFRLVRERVK